MYHSSFLTARTGECLRAEDFFEDLISCKSLQRRSDLWLTEQFQAEIHFGGSDPEGHNSVVSDFVEVVGQDMPKEPCRKFPYWKNHCFLFVVTVVFPSETDTIIMARHNPTVADGYPVGISSQVADDLIGPSERFFDVYVPVFGIQHLFDLIRMRIAFSLTIRNTKAALNQKFGQTRDEDTSINGGQRFYRDKELAVGMNPLGMVRV